MAAHHPHHPHHRQLQQSPPASSPSLQSSSSSSSPLRAIPPLSRAVFQEASALSRTPSAPPRPSGSSFAPSTVASSSSARASPLSLHARSPSTSSSSSSSAPVAFFSSSPSSSSSSSSSSPSSSSSSPLLHLRLVPAFPVPASASSSSIRSSSPSTFPLQPPVAPASSAASSSSSIRSNTSWKQPSPGYFASHSPSASLAIPSSPFGQFTDVATANKGFRLEFPLDPAKQALEGFIEAVVAKPLKEPKIVVELRGESCTLWKSETNPFITSTHGPHQIVRSRVNVNHADLMIPSNARKTLRFPFRLDLSSVPYLPPTYNDAEFLNQVMPEPLGQSGTITYTVRVTVSWVEGIFHTKYSKSAQASVLVCGMSPELKISLLSPKPLKQESGDPSISASVTLPRPTVCFGDPVPVGITVLRVSYGKSIHSLEASILTLITYRGTKTARIALPEPLAHVIDSSWEGVSFSTDVADNQRALTLYPSDVNCLPSFDSLALGVSHVVRLRFHLSDGEISTFDVPLNVVLRESSQPADTGASVPSYSPSLNAEQMVGLGLGLGMEKRPDSRITQKSDEQPAPSPIPPEPEQVNDPRMNSPQRAGVIGIMRVWANFSPGLADEIELKVGDQVIVDEIHEDGWALGTNVSSGRSGMLPMAVLLQESNSVSAVDALRFTSPLSQGRIRTVTNSTVSGEMTQESGFQAYNATPPTSYPQLFPEVFTSQLLLHRQQYLRTNTAPRRTASVLSARRSTQILSPSPSQGSLNRPSLSHRPSVLSSHASSGTVMPSSGNHLQSIHPSLTRSNSVTSSASSPIPTPTPSDFLSLPRVGAAPPRIPTLISKRSSNEAVPSVFDSLIEMIHDVSANTPPGSAAATFPAMAGSHDEDFSTPSLSPPTTTPSSSAESNHSMFSEMATFIPTPSASLVSAGTVADDKGAEISDFADYLDFWTSSTDETSSTLEPPRPAASHVVLSERKTAPSAGTTSTLVELDDKLRQGLLSGPEYLRQRDMLMGK